MPLNRNNLGPGSGCLSPVEIRDERWPVMMKKGLPKGRVNAQRTLHQGIELGGAFTVGQVVVRGQYSA